jgi:hypothetical protein
MIDRFLTFTLTGLLAVVTPPLAYSQSLETETARLSPRGALEIGSNFEYQVSSEGSETALPFALEYGVTDRLEFLVEPVAYTAIRPKTGSRAAGVGDVEAALTYRAHREARGSPALAFAGEAELPIARSILIGTGKADFAAYLIEQTPRTPRHARRRRLYDCGAARRRAAPEHLQLCVRLGTAVRPRERVVRRTVGEHRLRVRARTHRPHSAGRGDSRSSERGDHRVVGAGPIRRAVPSTLIWCERGQQRRGPAAPRDDAPRAMRIALMAAVFRMFAAELQAPRLATESG